jgi:hypothetical protein
MNNLFVCIDFEDCWSGVRFKGEWTRANSGGTPIKGTDLANKEWAKNP